MKVLMVCLGNICRSPLAEGILRDRIEKLGLNWEVDSAGTSGWHNGEAPDGRSIDVAQSNGINISDQVSRKFTREDFDSFDLILAMDTSNYNEISRLATNERQKEKVKLLMNYLFPNENRVVPDPYYDGGFDHVFDMISKAVDAMIEELEGGITS